MPDGDSDSDSWGSAPQNWLFVNLDKRQFHWTFRFDNELFIFWDQKKYGTPFPHPSEIPFDLIDLISPWRVNWVRAEVDSVGKSGTLL